MTPTQSLHTGRRDSPAASSRGFWPLRDLPVVGWLVGAVVVALVHPFVPAPRWLMIHLLLLGAAGHSILVWSRYFADTLLRGPATPRGEQSRRLALFNGGVLAVSVGVPARWWWLVLAGAVLVGAAVVWHVVALVRGIRTAMSSRFVVTVRFYVAAGLLLPIGAGLGAWLARDLAGPLEVRVRVAHLAVNLLGFVGLTVLGTVLTLGPTMLRTRITDGAERRAVLALPLLLGGIAVIGAGTWADVRLLVPAGLGLYLLGVVAVLVPLARAARNKPPTAFPTWSLGAGLLWLVGCLAALLVEVGLAGSWREVGAAAAALAPYLAAGFVAQVLLGALSYLVPVVLGGGPAAVRATTRNLDAVGAWRASTTNAGLLVCVLPVPSWVRVAVSALVLAALAAFVPVLLRAIRQRHAAAELPREELERPAGQNAGLAAVGLAGVVLAVALGGALDPTALGGAASSAGSGAEPTGRTVRVTVEAADMRFTPDRITVDAGDRLLITVRNTDDADVHDLVLETGHTTGRLAPGERATVDVGVVGRDLDGWCSVVGHRQMGMVLGIDARGTGHAPTGAPGFTPYDATLPPREPGTVHRHTFRVTEQETEAAPGVTQQLWTFNGTAPGPVLRGRVGDTFVIRLVNDGTIGHSIDFHAGVRAPDRVMRTIPPGKSLTYRFTATRAGIWMYHCSTMPMSAHIANGLFGAVVIEPRTLPPVDREYVLVQSEQYHGPQGGTVDMDALMAEEPDAVVFNGYPSQYDAHPLRARTGERVRIWVLDAGPNRPSSFHVVGGQFDTVFTEGAWRLGGPSGGSPEGGAQVLPLLPAQGGFVEMTFDEPGDYPLVSHLMVDAERGAHGVIRVR